MNLVHRGDSIVGFRPEKMLPTAALAGGEDGHRIVQLDVHRIEHLSGDRHLHGRLQGLGEPTRVIVRLPATVLVPIEVGETYDMAVRNEDLRYFDAESEKARNGDR